MHRMMELRISWIENAEVEVADTRISHHAYSSNLINPALFIRVAVKRSNGDASDQAKSCFSSLAAARGEQAHSCLSDAIGRTRPPRSSGRSPASSAQVTTRRVMVMQMGPDGLPC